MRNIWLIPDRMQDGQAYAIEGERVAPLNEILNLKSLPPELVIGIPEEIARKNSGGNFIYAQLAAIKSNENINNEWIFCLSAPAGTDKSDRIIFITNLQILSSDEDPEIPPTRPSNFPSDLDILAEQFDDTRSSAYNPVLQMIDARYKNSIAKSFSSERLEKSRFMPDWMPQKKRYNSYYVAVTILIIILILIIIGNNVINVTG